MKNVNQNNNILVSIVIPTYNRADLLKRCLDSVVNQTYRNIEIIVIDDNSTDHTQSLLNEYCEKDSRIVSLKNKNKGGNFARNEGIFSANGEYIALMDDDDVCISTRINDQLNAVIKSNYKYDFIISGYQLGDSNGFIRQKITYLKPLQSIGLTVRWFVKTDLLKEVGGFDTSQPALQEVELFWRLRQKSKIFFDKSVVVTIIGADVSITKKPELMVAGIHRLLDLHKDKMSKKEQMHWMQTLAIHYSRCNNWKMYYSIIKKIKIQYFGIFDVLLFAAYFFRNKRIINLYGKIQNFFHSIRKVVVYKSV